MAIKEVVWHSDKRALQHFPKILTHQMLMYIDEATAWQWWHAGPKVAYPWAASPNKYERTNEHITLVVCKFLCVCVCMCFNCQLVWATSNRIGCAINVCYNMNVWGMIWTKAVYLVCNYSPPYVSAGLNTMMYNFPEMTEIKTKIRKQSYHRFRF